MKIIFTEEEVKKIILDYAQRVHSAEVNTIKIAQFMRDYCVITYEEPPVTPEELEAA